jgi:hypothetical protein
VRIGTAIFGRGADIATNREQTVNQPDHRLHRRRQHGTQPDHGLLAAGVPPQHLRASDPAAAQRDALAAGTSAPSPTTPTRSGADMVVLAVKPQALRDVLGSLPLSGAELVISIAAGVPVSALETWAPAGTAIVRCMPNTPALLRAGITGLYATPRVSAAQRSVADTILRPPDARCGSRTRGCSMPSPPSPAAGPPTSSTSWKP